MITQIVIIKPEPAIYKLVDGMFECEHMNAEWERYSVYNPSQEQIDTNQDHDEERLELVCQDCGEALYD